MRTWTFRRETHSNRVVRARLSSLVLNYFGQGALLLTTADTTNPFYQLAPKWGIYPLVLLATAATVIAPICDLRRIFVESSGRIPGFVPRLLVVQTSAKKIDSICSRHKLAHDDCHHSPCTRLGTSSRLAGAYGVAVSTTMVITTFSLTYVTREL